jgi:hypothetical protein
MNRLKSINNFVQRWLQTQQSALRVLIQSNFTGIASNVQPSKPLLILGNGPSLNETLHSDQGLMDSFDLIAVNYATTHKKFEELKPRYYLINANTFFQEDHELNDLYLEINRELYHNLRTKTQWKMTMLVPFRAKKSRDFRQLLESNPHIDAAYFNQTPIEGLSFWSHWGYRLGWGMPRPHNVLIPCIMVGIRLGYRHIALVGADHSWLADLSVNASNEALLRHVHYYDTEGTKPMKMEDRIQQPRKLHEIIHKFYLSFEGYWRIKSFAEQQHITIINASKTSMIDAFARKSLAQFIQDMPQK